MNDSTTSKLIAAHNAELRRIAQSKLRHEESNSLWATELVNEAAANMLRFDPQQLWRDSAQFLAAAATTMKRVLIDRGRRRNTIKRGDAFRRISLYQADQRLSEQNNSGDWSQYLEDAINEYGRSEPKKAELVRLRLLRGYNRAEICAALEISPSTADAWWKVGRLRVVNLLDLEPAPAAHS